MAASLFLSKNVSWFKNRTAMLLEHAMSWFLVARLKEFLVCIKRLIGKGVRTEKPTVLLS